MRLGFILPTADKTSDGVQNASHRSILLRLTLTSLEFFSRGSRDLFVL
jgi:hypothetical protein